MNNNVENSPFSSFCIFAMAAVEEHAEQCLYQQHAVTRAAGLTHTHIYLCTSAVHRPTYQHCDWLCTDMNIEKLRHTRSSTTDVNCKHCGDYTVSAICHVETYKKLSADWFVGPSESCHAARQDKVGQKTSRAKINERDWRQDWTNTRGLSVFSMSERQRLTGGDRGRGFFLPLAPQSPSPQESLPTWNQKPKVNPSHRNQLHMIWVIGRVVMWQTLRHTVAANGKITSESISIVTAKSLSCRSLVTYWQQWHHRQAVLLKETKSCFHCGENARRYWKQNATFCFISLPTSFWVTILPLLATINSSSVTAGVCYKHSLWLIFN